MGGYDGYLITYFVHKTRGQEVYHQLNAEIDGDQQCYFFQGNPVGCDKGGKKQRYKVVDKGKSPQDRAGVGSVGLGRKSWVGGG